MTRDFAETVRDRAKRDPKFCRQLLRQAARAAGNGELDVASILLGDFEASDPEADK